MSKIQLNLCNGLKVEVDRGIEFTEIINKYYKESKLPIMLGRLNKKYIELSRKVEESGDFEVIYNNNPIGTMAYGRTVTFLFIKAALDIFPESKITMEHSISKGIFGEIHKEEVLTEEDVNKIKIRMQELIDRKIPISKINF